tara:strand:+ start:2030 stop:2305 length:276 start_codon:yes stop_codon:yes gene_type:complete
MVVPNLNEKVKQFIPSLVDIKDIERIVENQGSNITECRLNNEEVLKKLKENALPEKCPENNEKFMFGTFVCDYQEFELFKKFMNMKLKISK